MLASGGCAVSNLATYIMIKMNKSTTPVDLKLGKKLKAPNAETAFVSDLDLLGLLYHTVVDK